tara:strand:+ start:368 stop:658 length:291 start_codon:yes stop_codon:yes gene_type:complete
MVEVRFRTEADCIVWNTFARAKALVGRDLADLVSMCLQEIAALDHPEDVVRLPFSLTRSNGQYRIEIREGVAVVGTLDGRWDGDDHTFIVEEVVTP